MELDYSQHRVNGRGHWQDHPQPPVAFSPPQSASSIISQRRRSSAASARPAGPPPNLPIPGLPASPPNGLAFPDSSDIVPAFPSGSPSNPRGTRSSSFVRPSASPSLSAVAAFSQARQASSSSSSQNQQPSIYLAMDDLSDPPPGSYLPPNASRSSDRNHDSQAHRTSLAPPNEHSHRSEQRPSSRRALTRALELAREAVQLDSTNDNPEAAVNAYAQSVALLSEVMERVRNGEDSTTDSSHRRRRRRSVTAQEEEVRRLQKIHDTYADRMNILSIIYSIPAVPYPTSSLYSNTTISTDSTTSNSPTTSTSPSSDSSPHIPHQVYTPHIQDEPQLYTISNPPYTPDIDSSRDVDGVYTLDEEVLRGSVISGLPANQHPYSVSYDSFPQHPAPTRHSMSARRGRISSQLPPKPPPPTNSLPPAPVMNEPKPNLSTPTTRRPDAQLRIGDSIGHRRTSSGLGALTEETDEIGRLDPYPQSHTDYPENPLYIPDTPRTTKRDSPPLPPLPSPPLPPDNSGMPRSLPPSRTPPSPRLSNAARPRGSSQLTTRTELATVPHINATTQGTIHQRRKTSAPPSTRSASPADSITSAGSAPHSKSVVPSLPNNGIISGRHRSSSQPGRRPSLIGGKISPPPLPGSSVVNGTPRKPSIPSRLNANVSLDPQSLQSISFNQTYGFPGNLPTTPTSPLPPIGPADPLLKPYHMMNLLRNTMTAPTGGYVTRRLHVPCEVWSQGGVKLTNLDEKIRVVTCLGAALETLQLSSAEHFGAGNVSSGLALGIGSIGRREANAWLLKLEEFSSVCDMVVSNYGKKLGVGEGFVLKKSTWGGKLTRQLDKFTNGKNLDSPTTYVDELKKLFMHAQLLDEHTRAALSQPVAPAYAAFPVDIRGSTEQKLKRISEFFAKVVLTFVIRDLSQLLDKYAKKCEKWLAE
ncbi:hypothetical protein B0H34DRAFT_854752 [Crassisporium funariophilum]|nr:hypothetical protein B0H34DRAFT_854752 [Crassisporium funariophilum]